LLGRYGDEAPGLLQQASTDECRLIEGTRWCLAELRWSCRNEQIVHLDDLLLRRSRLGLLLKDGGTQLFPALKSLCQQELGWNDAQWQAELQRYQDLWRTYYSLPRG
jgi:glycerol-3-phosphate dehydrogenase